MKHAKLSASGAKKWLNCPLSIKLESKIPNESSTYAEEGTKAHELSELKLRRNLNLISKDTYDIESKRLNIDVEMDKYTDYYCNAVLEIVHKYDLNYSIVKLEERVDFSPWVIEGFGTSDVIVISDNVVEIIDLKYGKGVLVSAENNPQLMLYALGVLNDYGYLYNIDKVIMTIVQPRLDNISSFSMNTSELLEWGKDVRGRASKAYKEEGECVVGNHCDDGFCRARAICKAYADNRLEIAKHEFKDPEELDVNDLSDILSKIDKLVSWGNIVKKYALNQALDGLTINGYKLVEGRSNRAYGVDESKIADVLISNGYKEGEIYEKSIKSVSSMEKWLGKSKFKSILGELVIKPPGKPTLVPVDDPRQEFNSAINDFKERVVEKMNISNRKSGYMELACEALSDIFVRLKQYDNYFPTLSDFLRDYRRFEYGILNHVEERLEFHNDTLYVRNLGLCATLASKNRECIQICISASDKSIIDCQLYIYDDYYLVSCNGTEAKYECEKEDDCFKYIVECFESTEEPLYDDYED